MNAINFHRVGFIDQIEKRRKCVAEANAAATAMADVKNALELVVQRLFIPETVALPVQRMPGGSVDDALSHCN